MIFVLLSWIYLLCVFYGAGFLFLLILKSTKVIPKNSEIPRTDLVLLSGFPIITFALAFWNFFLGISYHAHFVFDVILIIVIIYHKKNIFFKVKEDFSFLKQNPIASFCFFTVIFLILIETVKIPTHEDTALYHAQMVQWIRNFPVIKGLGNLHGRFAFNSHLQLLEAYSELEIFGKFVYHQFNGFIFLIYTIFSALSLKSYIANSEKVSLKLILFALFSYPMAFIACRNWISSLSTDLPATVFVLISFTILLDMRSLKEATHLNFTFATLILLIFFLITIKLSTFPILFLLLFLIIKYPTLISKRIVMFSLISGSLILIPWILRNILLSGYLIYPFYQIDLFTLDWKIPLVKAINENFLIQNNARLPRPDWNNFSYTGHWLPYWVQHQNVINHLLFVITLLSIPYWAFQLIKRWNSQKNNYLIIWFISIMGIFYWFFKAPDYRFVHGFLIANSLLTITIAMDYFLHRYLSRSFFIYFPIFLFIIFLIVRNLFSPLMIKDTYLFPSEYPKVEAKSYSIKNVVFYVPVENGKCWNTSIPCVPYHQLLKEIRMRGSGLKEGFQAADANSSPVK